MNIQAFLDSQVKAMRRQSFSGSPQLSLGQLIQKVEAIAKNGYRCGDGSEPCVVFDFCGVSPGAIHSWRGSYSELAIGYDICPPEVSRCWSEKPRAFRPGRDSDRREANFPVNNLLHFFQVCE